MAPPISPIPSVPADGKFHIDPSNPMNRIKHIKPWYPPGLTDEDLLWGGSTAKVAKMADGTALKFVWDKDDPRAKYCLNVEHSILSELGSHHRIVRYLGKNEHGLKFDLAANGDVRRYLSGHESDATSHQLRLKWAQQAAEALAFVHEKGVIRCDVHPNNLLLDEQLDIRLCDFAGSLFGALDGGAMESTRFFLPRDPLATPNTKSDLFALGSTMYFIMSDHEPYSDLTDEEVTACYSRMEYPAVQGFSYATVIEGCWKGEFESGQEVFDVISAINARQGSQWRDS